jgi:hypothetical protein
MISSKVHTKTPFSPSDTEEHDFEDEPLFTVREDVSNVTLEPEQQ